MIMYFRIHAKLIKYDESSMSFKGKNLFVFKVLIIPVLISYWMLICGGYDIEIKRHLIIILSIIILFIKSDYR